MSLVRPFAALLIFGGSAATAEAQKTHAIELQVDREKEIYSFSPATVTASPGDVLVFKVVNGEPHSVAFEAKGLSPAVRSALNAAMSRRAGDLTSPALTKKGAEYKIVLPKIPAGRYSYFCLPHRAYDMRGEIIIK